MPIVDEILDDMRGSSIFTTIDLFQRYWQIKIDDACKENVKFIFRYGTFQFEVMLFGMMNSQATFQRMMDRIPLNVTDVRCYVDDVVIFSTSAEEHASHLENVFAVLNNNGLRLRIKKCSFVQPSVELFEHIVDNMALMLTNRKWKN